MYKVLRYSIALQQKRKGKLKFHSTILREIWKILDDLPYHLKVADCKINSLFYGTKISFRNHKLFLHDENLE